MIPSAAATRTLFANAAEACLAQRITSVPALTAITFLAPGFEGGVVAVARNKVPAEDVEAPDETELDLSLESQRMVCAIHIVGSFFWAPCRVGLGISEDLHCQ